MTKIKNVTLGFNCTEKVDCSLYCQKCSRQIINFSEKTEKELINKLKQSKDIVCGVFKKSQLSENFLRYATATVMLTSTLTVPTLGQENKIDTVQITYDTVRTEDVDFIGTVVELMPEPVGGIEKFLANLKSQLKQIEGLKGKVFVSFVVNKSGELSEYKVIKSLNETADREAIRVLANMDYKWSPARQNGKALSFKYVLPITFGEVEKTENDSKKRKRGNKK